MTELRFERLNTLRKDSSVRPDNLSYVVLYDRTMCPCSWFVCWSSDLGVIFKRAFIW